MTIPINTQYALSGPEGSPSKSTAHLGVLHSTADTNATAVNVAHYEKNNFNASYVHFIVDDTTVCQVGTPGYQAWGAYGTANSRAQLQIELCEFSDHDRAIKAYRNYIALIREQAPKYGVPLTYNSDDVYNGWKTHRWVSQHFEGDHTDPVGYLESIGISEAQFASDIANGSGASTVSPTPTPASTATTASQPAAAPKTYRDGQYTITAENGTFYPDRTLSVWYYPGLNPTGAKYHAGESVNYYGYVRNGAYLYVAYHANDGYTHYVACRDYTNGNEALGSFK